MKRKLIIPLLATFMLAGCLGPQGQQAYVTDIQTDLAAEYKVPISDIKISFLQSCVFDFDSVNTIFYVQVKDSKTIYQYKSEDCQEKSLDEMTKSVYSEDGNLPESFEKDN